MKKLLILILLITCLLTVGITPTFCNVNLANAEEPKELYSHTIDINFTTDKVTIIPFMDEYTIIGDFRYISEIIKLKSIGYYSINLENIVYKDVRIIQNSTETYKTPNYNDMDFSTAFKYKKNYVDNFYIDNNKKIFYNSESDFEVKITLNPNMHIKLYQSELPKDIIITMEMSCTIRIFEFDPNVTEAIEALFLKQNLPLKTTYRLKNPDQPIEPPPPPPDTRTENEKRWDNIEKFIKKNPKLVGIGITILITGAATAVLAIWAQVARAKTNYKIAQNTYNAFKNRKNNRRKRR